MRDQSEFINEGFNAILRRAQEGHFYIVYPQIRITDIATTLKLWILNMNRIGCVHNEER